MSQLFKKVLLFLGCVFREKYPTLQNKGALSCIYPTNLAKPSHPTPNPLSCVCLYFRNACIMHCNLQLFIDIMFSRLQSRTSWPTPGIASQLNERGFGMGEGLKKLRLRQNEKKNIKNILHKTRPVCKLKKKKEKTTPVCILFANITRKTSPVIKQ